MSDLVGQKGELRATIEIKRAATGKVEYYDIVGFVDPADLDALLAGKTAALGVAEAEGALVNDADMDALIDHAACVDQDAVTSTVEVNGVVTVRTYSDGAVQRNIWETEELAQEYADSVNGGSE